MVEEVKAEPDDMCDSLNVGNEVDKSEDVRVCTNLIIRISREASKRLATDILNFLHQTCLINSDYQTHLKSLHKCKTVADESMNARLSDLKMKPVTIHETGNSLREKHHTLYMKNAVEVIQKQMNMAKAHDVVFRPSKLQTQFETGHKSNFPMSLISTKYFVEVYKSVKLRVQRTTDFDVTWNEDFGNDESSFVGMLQLYSDKTATTLKASATVAYPVHLVLLNFTAEYRRHLIDHGYTIVGLLPVSASESTEDTFKNSTEEENMTEGQKVIIPLPDGL